MMIDLNIYINICITYSSYTKLDIFYLLTMAENCLYCKPNLLSSSRVKSLAKSTRVPNAVGTLSFISEYVAQLCKIQPLLVEGQQLQ